MLICSIKVDFNYQVGENAVIFYKKKKKSDNFEKM